jgi:hypothetical protein
MAARKKKKKVVLTNSEIFFLDFVTIFMNVRLCSALFMWRLCFEVQELIAHFTMISRKSQSHLLYIVYQSNQQFLV